MEFWWLTLGILLSQLITFANAFCPLGCTCSDETRNVICDNVRVDSIPIFLNPALTRLSLRNSQVQLDKDSIRLYKDLQYLDLSHNNLQEFPSEFFDQLTNLVDLRLTGNQITKIETDLFANLEKLEHLDLSANKIDQIDSNSLDSLILLNYLNLSANHLQFVEPIFNSLTQLKVLDVSRNDVRTVASGSFNGLRALQKLDLSENSISHLHPQIFAHQNQLSTLNLQGNRLEEIQRNVFDGLFILESLNLSRNMLKTIDVSNYQKLEKLEILDLSNNPLFALESTFKGMLSLRVLHLNSIDYLTEIKNNSFDGLYKLEELSISGCTQLNRIHPAAFSDNLSLKRVDLSSNSLHTLGPNTLRWELLEYLNLAGNPWNCDCSLLSFLPSVLRRIKRSGSSRAVCVLPEQMLGVELSNAKSPLCSSASNSTLILLGAAVFLTLLIIIVLFVLCVRSAIYWRQKRKLANNKNGRVPLYAPSSSFSDSLIYDKQHDASATMVVTCEPSGRSVTSSNSLNYPRFQQPFCYQQHETNDYYSSIPLPPPQFEPCHNCTNGYSTCTLGMIPNYAHYPVEASPYAIGQSRMLPPSFVAPPPPPSIPPPKLAYRHVDA